MSELNQYKPFTIVENAINRLETQGLLKLLAQKDQVAELITRDLITAGVLKEFINIERPLPTNFHNSLEEFVTEGRKVTYIRQMEFDATQDIFILELQFDPASNSSDKTLIFRNVQAFESILDEGEEEESLTDYLEQIIGLDEYSTKYILKTDIREIMFFSETVPEVLLGK